MNKEPNPQETRDSVLSNDSGTNDIIGSSAITSSSTRNNALLLNDSTTSVFGGGYPSDIRKKYHLTNDVLGEGSFGTVRKCRLLGSDLVCALKTIDKSKLPDATQLRREVDILLSVNHPHIIKLYDVYEDETVSA